MLIRSVLHKSDLTAITIIDQRTRAQFVLEILWKSKIKLKAHTQLKLFILNSELAASLLSLYEPK